MAERGREFLWLAWAAAVLLASLGCHSLSSDFAKDFPDTFVAEAGPAGKPTSPPVSSPTGRAGRGEPVRENEGDLRRAAVGSSGLPPVPPAEPKLVAKSVGVPVALSFAEDSDEPLEDDDESPFGTGATPVAPRSEHSGRRAGSSTAQSAPFEDSGRPTPTVALSFPQDQSEGETISRPAVTVVCRPTVTVVSASPPAIQVARPEGSEGRAAPSTGQTTPFEDSGRATPTAALPFADSGPASPTVSSEPMLTSARPQPTSDSSKATEVPLVHDFLLPNDELAEMPTLFPRDSCSFSDPHLPRELSKAAVGPYVIEPPDILLVEAAPIGFLDGSEQRISGEHLVRPDGTVGLGIYGSVRVAGLTLDEARIAIENHLKEALKIKVSPRVNVDIFAYNSKAYYIVADNAGYGQQVFRLPYTGNETVLDAIGQIGGLPATASKKKIWIARPCPDHTIRTLPVDWKGIAQDARVATNYQLFPGDRIYIQSDRLMALDGLVSKIVAPIERVFGVTFLGAQTIFRLQNMGRGAGGAASGGI